MTTSRRDFMKTAAALAAVSAAGGLAGRASAATQAEIEALYADAIVIDTLSFAFEWNEHDIEMLDRSGYTGIFESLPRRNLKQALDGIIRWKQRIRQQPDRFLMALSASDFERAKAESKLAVLMNFQNTTMLEGDVDNVDVIHGLGGRCFQLTYNQRNRVGDGSTERTNAGLSDFGIEVVNRMNDLGVIVDVSHSGRQTTFDAVEFSSKPVAFTHTMCEAIRTGHPRAKTDAQIRAMADKGGVMSIAAIGYFIGKNPGTDTTIETYGDHIDHAVNVAGIDHVGVATDFQIGGLAEYATYEDWYLPRLSSFKPSYDVQWPPWLPEMDPPERFLNLWAVLDRRGYSTGQMEKLLGQNWLRFMGDVFGS